jgi:hypothetical protein
MTPTMLAAPSLSGIHEFDSVDEVPAERNSMATECAVVTERTSRDALVSAESFTYTPTRPQS